MRVAFLIVAVAVMFWFASLSHFHEILQNSIRNTAQEDLLHSYSSMYKYVYACFSSHLNVGIVKLEQGNSMAGSN